MAADLHPLGSSADLHWSARALELAAKADFRTSPNPMVGAVVLDSEGLVAGEGYHRGPGSPHAEEEALASAGERARGGGVSGCGGGAAPWRHPVRQPRAVFACAPHAFLCPGCDRGGRAPGRP